VEDIITQWNSDLEEQVKSFTEQALEVKKWDEQLFENGTRVSGLLEWNEEGGLMSLSLCLSVEQTASESGSSQSEAKRAKSSVGDHSCKFGVFSEYGIMWLRSSFSRIKRVW